MCVCAHLSYHLLSRGAVLGGMGCLMCVIGWAWTCMRAWSCQQACLQDQARMHVLAHPIAHIRHPMPPRTAPLLSR
jgi:hypothetical protein